MAMSCRFRQATLYTSGMLVDVTVSAFFGVLALNAGLTWLLRLESHRRSKPATPVDAPDGVVADSVWCV